jgi:hypothetical protein
MNKFIYLFITLFAIGFSSCSKDDVSQETGVATTLKVSITGIGVNTKAHSAIIVNDAGSTVGTGEAKINRITVAVFKAASANTVDDSDPVDVIYETVALTGSSVSVPVTAGNRSVLVVANAPAGAFENITTRSGFKSKTLSLDLTAKGVDGEAESVESTQSISNLPMEGEITYVTGTTINTGTTTTASVILKRLVARVAITSITTQFSGAYANATFTPTEIFLYNANTSFTWGSVASTSLFKQGETLVPANYCSYLGNTVSGYTTNIGDPYYFYTFPNDATSPTKLVIKGTFDPDGGTASNAKTVYYPIVINLYNVNTSNLPDGASSTAKIEANKAYNLTAIIKGEGSTGASVDITPVNLTVNVSVQAWTAVPQNVVFN